VPLNNVPAIGSRAAPLPDTPHTKFVVLGHPRCGSNLLVRALDEHPQVRVIGEVLARDEETRNTAWRSVNPSAWKQPRGDGYRLGEDGGQFLQREIFVDTAPDNFRAFGFKLFYEDGRWDPNVSTAWDYLAAADVHVIHLIRRNLLLALISEEVALRTNRWFHLIEQKDQSSSPLPPFPLTPAACENYFKRIANWRVWTREQFGKHPFLTVEYEFGLVNDFRATTMQVYDFLGVIPWIVRPGLVKQQGVPASRQISNFEELRRHFRNSEFALFFETADLGIQARA